VQANNFYKCSLSTISHDSWSKTVKLPTSIAGCPMGDMASLKMFKHESNVYVINIL